MKYLLACFIFFTIYNIIALGISDFKSNNIKNIENLNGFNNNSVKAQWCYGDFINTSVFCNSLIKNSLEKKIFDSNDKFFLNSNILGSSLYMRPSGMVNQISLQDQTLRDALSRFGSNYFISIQPIEGLDMTLGTNQLKFNYKY